MPAGRANPSDAVMFPPLRGLSARRSARRALDGAHEAAVGLQRPQGLDGHGAAPLPRHRGVPLREADVPAAVGTLTGLERVQCPREQGLIEQTGARMLGPRREASGSSVLKLRYEPISRYFLAPVAPPPPPVLIR
jgi:hypothetical protein